MSSGTGFDLLLLGCIPAWETYCKIWNLWVLQMVCLQNKEPSGAFITNGVVHGYVFHFTEGKAAGRLGFSFCRFSMYLMVFEHIKIC